MSVMASQDQISEQLGLNLDQDVFSRYLSCILF